MTDLGAIAGNDYDSAAFAVNDSREIGNYVRVEYSEPQDWGAPP